MPFFMWLLKLLPFLGPVAKKVDELLPWKVIIAGIAILAIIVAGLVAKNQYDRMREELVASARNAAIAEVKEEVAKKTTEEIKRQTEDMTRRLQTLEEARAAVEAQTAELNTAIDNLKLKEGLQHDPDGTIRALNDSVRRLDGLLEQRSRGN